MNIQLRSVFALSVPRLARLLAFVAAALLVAARAHAVTITVNSTADVVDNNNGYCTLREAIKAANSNFLSGSTPGECAAGSLHGETDAIVFSNLIGSPDVYNLAIPPSGPNNVNSGDLNITESVIIAGNGHLETIIAGNWVDRVFRIEDEDQMSVKIFHVTIQTGLARHGGGIYKLGGELTIEMSRIRQNIASCFGACSAEGGGLWNAKGNVSIVNSSITQNSAQCAGGHCFASGGGVRNAPWYDPKGTITMVNSRVSYNDAHCEGDDCRAAGGGMWNSGEVDTYQHTLFYANWITCAGQYCLADGGGIFTMFGRTLTSRTTLQKHKADCSGIGCSSRGGAVHNRFGTVSIGGSSVVVENRTSCALSGCHAFGGGIFNQADSGSSLSIVGSTLSTNVARTLHKTGVAQGGGAFNVGTSFLQINTSTVSANSAEGGLNPAGGGVFNSGTSWIHFSALTGNAAAGERAAGGAIANTFEGHVNVINVTLSTNTAACQPGPCSSFGGGLFNAGVSHLSFVTVFDNAAVCSEGCPGNAGGGGVFNSAGGLVKVKNSILGHHSAAGSDCAGDVSQILPFGDNFRSDNSCGSGFYLENPLIWLGPLAYNGGSEPDTCAPPRKPRHQPRRGLHDGPRHLVSIRSAGLRASAGRCLRRWGLRAVRVPLDLR